jgi:hypothetical protein
MPFLVVKWKSHASNHCKLSRLPIFGKWITTLKQEKGTKYRLIVSSHPLQPSVGRMSRQRGIVNISQSHKPPGPVTGIGNSTITDFQLSTVFETANIMGKQLQLVRNQSF